MIKNINYSTYFFLFFFEQVREKKRKKERKKFQFPRAYPTIIEVHLGIIKQVYHKSNSQVYSILFWKSFHQELIWRASWRVPDQMQVIPTNFSSIYLMFAKRQKDWQMQKKLPSAENNEADSIAKESKKSSDKSCHPGEPVLPRLSKDQMRT